MTTSEAFLAYWPIIVFVIGGIVSVITIWINLNNKVNALKSEMIDMEKDAAELKGKVDTMQPTLGTIQTDIAVIKNTLEYIKGSVSKPILTNTNL